MTVSLTPLTLTPLTATPLTARALGYGGAEPIPSLEPLYQDDGTTQIFQDDGTTELTTD